MSAVVVGICVAMLGVGLALAVTGRIHRPGEVDAVTLTTGLVLLGSWAADAVHLALDPRVEIAA